MKRKLVLAAAVTAADAVESGDRPSSQSRRASSNRSRGY